MTLPDGTTWLDLATLFIAVVGGIIALISLGLGIRTDRRESKTRLRVRVLLGGGGQVIFQVTNMAQRRVTAQRTGFADSKRDDRSLSFIGWNQRNAAVVGARVRAEESFPETLEPGAPTYEAKAPLYVVRNSLTGRMPKWAWCEDERGNAYWVRVHEVVRSAVDATKRRVPGPDDAYGHPTEVEVDDD